MFADMLGKRYIGCILSLAIPIYDSQSEVYRDVSDVISSFYLSSWICVHHISMNMGRLMYLQH